MFIKDVMTREWQDFFRSLYTRVGGHTAYSSDENLVLEVAGSLTPSPEVFGKRLTDIERKIYSETSDNSLIQRVMNLERRLESIPTPKDYAANVAEHLKRYEGYPAPLDYRKIISEVEKALAADLYTSSIDPHGAFWTCVDLDPALPRLPVANPPAADEIDNFRFHRYNRATVESVHMAWNIPEEYVGGAFNVRAYYSFVVENPPNGGGDEAVVMGFEHKRIAEGDVFDFTGGTTSATVTETLTDGETAYVTHFTTKSYFSTATWTHDDTILFRFYRDATNAADTYDNEAAPDDNDVWVYQYHLEYKTKEF
jgi:hypothetical protein